MAESKPSFWQRFVKARETVYMGVKWDDPMWHRTIWGNTILALKIAIKGGKN